MPRPPQFFTVRVGTQARPCSSCAADIYWITTDSGARMPVDCNPARVLEKTGAEGVKPPTAQTVGRGVAHWGTCPNAAQHRKRA